MKWIIRGLLFLALISLTPLPELLGLAVAKATKPKPTRPPFREVTPTPTPALPLVELVPGVLFARGLNFSPATADSEAKFWHPVRPDDVSVTLQTFDGQRWVARWEPSK